MCNVCVRRSSRLQCVEFAVSSVLVLTLGIAYREENCRQVWYFMEEAKAIASMPLWSLDRCPSKCSRRNWKFPHRVPITKEKMPWCPCPFKKQSIEACVVAYYMRQLGGNQLQKGHFISIGQSCQLSDSAESSLKRNHLSLIREIPFL